MGHEEMRIDLPTRQTFKVQAVVVSKQLLDRDLNQTLSVRVRSQLVARARYPEFSALVWRRTQYGRATTHGEGNKRCYCSPSQDDQLGVRLAI
jgi:hypothetical protein